MTRKAGIVGVPIFIGLCVGTDCIVQVLTVNVRTTKMSRFSRVLDSNVFQKGLAAGNFAQPADCSALRLALGLT